MAPRFDARCHFIAAAEFALKSLLFILSQFAHRMHLKVATATVLVALLVAFCNAIQDNLQRSIFACDRHSSWNPDYLGAYSPLCMHVYSSIEKLMTLRREQPQASFASAAWTWIDDASACIYFVAMAFTNAIDDVALHKLKFHHKVILKNAIIFDKQPLVLDEEACQPFLAKQGSLKRLKVHGIQPHPKLGIKHFNLSKSGSEGAHDFSQTFFNQHALCRLPCACQ